jgi:hypothetical protein
MHSALLTEPPTAPANRGISVLNTIALVFCALGVMGALGIAALSVPAIASAVNAVLSWLILLVIAVCEFLWAGGAALGLLLSVIGLSRRETRNGAAVPAVVCLLLLVGYVFFAAVGPSFLFG